LLLKRVTVVATVTVKQTFQIVTSTVTVTILLLSTK
jgi:hypothetical protein